MVVNNLMLKHLVGRARPFNPAELVARVNAHLKRYERLTKVHVVENLNKEAVEKPEYVAESATVTVHINRIREKIEDDPKKPKIIETVWGAGYRLNV